ncbi:hypothetical protein VNO80_05803 [Phaseolus coccineus]|uniref:Cucumisin-like n=1 Tax=Phaseolus coccineus TaxID=3886 RepID=A0AAN9RE12_PHACN
MRSGILTSKSAGNSGPNSYTMKTVAPWYISGAATTVDRKFYTNLQLGNGQIIHGISVNTFSPTQNDYPLIYGGDVPAPGFNSSTSCDPTTIISKNYEEIDLETPYIAPFSSRGPNKVTSDILKPDIAAPGVDLLASWSPLSPISGVKGDLRLSIFNVVSGTSMACAHVTAAAVYLKSFHPGWSPAALKSALMTTATPLNPALNEDAEFAYGAGQINPWKAVYPGLVYDVGPNDYINFLCGQGYSAALLRIITGDNNTCTSSANARSVFNLNLPSFALSTVKSQDKDVTFGRTVTNVGLARSTYRAIVSNYSSSLNIEVVPDVLTFTSLGQRPSFTLRIQGTINADLVSFSLTWDDGTHQARSPVVVYAP